MAASTGKVVIIGLELGDGRLLHDWASAGRLPAVRSLIESGCWGWLATTAEQLHVSAWPSIYTGTGPGEHGVYFTFQPAPGLQGYQRFHPGLYGRPTFWRLLSDAGRGSIVFDAPYAHLEDGFDGIQILDWGTWAHYLQPSSTPAHLLQDLERACGPYPLGLEAHDLGMAALDPGETQTRILESIRAKTAASCWLMKQAEWDVFFTVFGETHVAAHYCWSPESPGSKNGDGESLMLGIYQELDRAIDRIRAAAGEDAALIVISGDSVGPNHTGWHLLPDVLTRLGYLANQRAGASGSPEARPGRRRIDPVKAVRDLLPKNFRKSLARKLPSKLRDKLAQRVDMADVDWSGTRAYCLPTDLEGCIRVNLRGREPMGIVEPGTEYESLCDEIAAALGELVDPETNRKVVRAVIRTDHAFPGVRRGHLPDLIVQWNPSRPITQVASPRIGTMARPSPDPRPGTHTGPGFVLGQGPGIAAGRVLESGHIFDLAPTILARFGAAAPDYMQGKVWNTFVIN